MSDLIDEIQKIAETAPRVKHKKWYYVLSRKKRKQLKIMQVLIEMNYEEIYRAASKMTSDYLLYGIEPKEGKYEANN